MSYSYSHSAVADSYRPARRGSPAWSSGSSERDPSPPPWPKRWASNVREATSSRHGLWSLFKRIARYVFTVSNALIALWICTLWWGERTVFRDSVKACNWGNWERWVGDPCCNSSLSYFLSSANFSCSLDTAPGRNSTSCRLHRRPTISRPSHLSRPAMASFDVDRQIHRSIPSEILLIHSERTRSRFCFVSG